MKTFFLSFLLWIAPLAVIAQEQAEDLTFKSGTWNYNYYVGDQQVSYDAFKKKLMENNERLAIMFNSGKNLSLTGIVMGSAGGFCLGYDIGTRFAGGKGNTLLLAGGGVAMGIGILMCYVGEGKMKKALTLYKNRDNNTSLTIGTNYSGFGISLNF
ncbi:MAG: hypothetical protein LBP72_00075 [Dysgonamonadaceae bacterium]|jgi:hypothetical protein|nr:hypothetical protein [Dysgonamonadaceae bacterium]